MEEKNKLFVGSLSVNVDKEKLASVFEEVEGIKVLEATIIFNRETQTPRGFGFVKVETEEMAQKAITELNGKEVDGQKIVVNIAKPQENGGRPNGDRGGFSRDRRY